VPAGGASSPPLSGGFGHQPLGTTTGVRGARWTQGQAGAGNTRSTDRPRPRKPGLRLSSLRWKTPWGKSRGGTPAGERARKRRAARAALSVARTARRLRADNRTLRLPAFRPLIFFRSFPFVIAGHSRSQNGVTSFAYAGNPCETDACTALPSAFVSGAAAWTIGSSPVVTSKRQWRAIARALSRAARTRLLLPPHRKRGEGK
jgi:hypothetical protein